MKKINESYLHEETGMTFDVEYISKRELPDDCAMGVCLHKEEEIVGKEVILKKVKIMPSAASGWVRGDKGFVFNRSKPETIQKIGRALLDIGEFVEKL